MNKPFLWCDAHNAGYPENEHCWRCVVDEAASSSGILSNRRFATFGAFLRWLRRDRGYSADALGRKVGRSKAWILGIELGKLPPPPKKILIRMASILRADADAMFRVGASERLFHLDRDLWNAYHVDNGAGVR